MKLPPIPAPPTVHLPPQLIIPLDALAAFWALVIIALGFVYLLFGVKVFRVMSTITAAGCGVALGIRLGVFIDSVIVGMVLCGAGLGVATWFYTRWLVALPVGLMAGALAWSTATLNGANPLAAFFICLGAAVAVGGPVLLFYRSVMIAMTCLQGAVLVVIGTSAAILLLRHVPVASLQNDLHSSGHLLLAGVCVALLAVPSFHFQQLRYALLEGAAGDTNAGKEPKKKDE